MFVKLIIIVSILTRLNQLINCELIDSLINLNEFETLERLLNEEMNNLYYGPHHDFSTRDDDLLLNEETIEQFNKSIVDLFSTPRNHENPTQKLEFQTKLKNKLINYGYDNVVDQVFRVRYLETKNNKDELQYELGKNIIATLNGRFSEESKQIQREIIKKIINLRSNKIDKSIFNETITSNDLAVIEQNLISKQKDKLVIIGAHYDTLNNINGIEDNASGCLAVLEMARLLKNFKFKLNYTIMFVWFDFEEINGLGSSSFVNHFLIPTYIKKQNSIFHSAIILDMLFKIDEQLKNDQIEKQKTSSFNNNILNDVYQDVLLLNNSISIWYRKKTDSSLANQLINSFNLKNKNDIILNPILINNDNENKISNLKDRFYLRGDHYSFWSLPTKRINNKNNTYELPTVFISNMTPWRGIHRLDCYHKECDDLRQLTKDNLIFLNRLIYLLRDALINLE